MILTTEQWEEVQKMKAEIKKQAAIQGKEKAILRTPHGEIKMPHPERPGSFLGAGSLMWRTQDRARGISKLLIQYNQMRGRPWEIHLTEAERKERAAVK